MLKLNVGQFKKFFFDSKKVLNATDKATRSVLSKFGAFVRTTAKSSIRSRKKISAPGQPPSSHTGILKKFIFFGFDTKNKSVVIGPARLNQKDGDAPPALEYGGKSTAINYRKNKKIAQKINVKARPFMGPALKKELPKLPSMWANNIKA